MRNPIDQAQQETIEGRTARMEAAKADPKMEKNMGEIATLRRAEIGLSEQLLNLHEQLAEFRAGIGDRVVDNLLSGTPGEIDDTAKLEAQAAPIIAGIDTARDRCRKALEARSGILVSVLRGGELQELQGQANAHQKKVGVALRRLEKLEGCRFVSVGVMAVSAQAVVDSYEGMIPLSNIYQARLEILTREADNQVGVKPRDSGNLTARDRDNLIQQVLDLDAETIGPSIPDVLAWLDTAETPQIERRDLIPAGVRGHDSPLFYFMEYAGGKVDRTKSRVVLPALDTDAAGLFLSADRIRAAGSGSSDELSGEEFPRLLREARTVLADKLIDKEEFDLYVGGLTRRLEATRKAAKEAEEAAEEEKLASAVAEQQVGS